MSARKSRGKTKKTPLPKKRREPIVNAEEDVPERPAKRRRLDREPIEDAAPDPAPAPQPEEEPEQKDAPTMVVAAAPVVATVDTAFAKGSFKFTKRRSKRMKTEDSYRRLVKDGQDIASVPESMRRAVSVRVERDRDRLSQDYHANRVVMYVTRLRDRSVYYRDIGVRNPGPQRGPEQLWVDALILDLEEAGRCVSAGASKVKLVDATIGRNVVKALQLPMMDFSDRNRPKVWNPEEYPDLAKRAMLTTGSHVRFKIPRTNIKALECEFASVSQLYYSKITMGEGVKFSMKGRICDSLMQKDLRKSHSSFVADVLKNMALLFDQQMLNPPASIPMEEIQNVDDQTGEVTVRRVPKKVLVTDGDGEPVLDSDGNQVLRPTKRPASDYRGLGLQPPRVPEGRRAPRRVWLPTGGPDRSAVVAARALWHHGPEGVRGAHDERCDPVRR